MLIYQPKLSMHRTYIMTTHNDSKCFIHFDIVLFYTVVCPFLRLENGKIDYNTTSLVYYDNFGYSVNTMASFSCDTFYHREGNSSAICQSSGNWSEPTPTCNSSNVNEN